MKFSYRLLLVFLAAGLLLAGSRQASGEGKFNLKPGAKGKICLTCHANFEAKMKQPFVHTPVKSGNCDGCHNPHTSSHGKFLAADPNKVCYLCHANMVPDKAVSTHKVVLEGNCAKCHDPHGTKNRYSLLEAGNDLCFGCHKTMKEPVEKAKFPHAPVTKGCMSCHNPHASTKADFLLKQEVPALCLNCHKTNTPSFAKQHMNYPVGKAVCTSCHNPHGSDRGGILYNNVHKPVANKMCNQCHDEPNSQTPFATKKPGYELCRGCHNTMMNETFGKNRIHWPLMTRNGCLSCHNPHASSEKKLIKGPMKAVCGKCHADTIDRQERSVTKHPPIREGNCTACHSPHSSDSSYLLSQAAIVELCGTCHDWMKHSTHPIGEKIIDPRNKNLIVTCVTCHRSHGTENKNFLYTPAVSELCTQCHVKFKR